MRNRRLVLVLVWFVSLLAVSRWGATQAQSNAQRGPGGEQVLTGDDIGFMLLPPVGNRPAGAFVIRQQGQWVIPDTGRLVSPDAPGGRVVPLR